MNIDPSNFLGNSLCAICLSSASLMITPLTYAQSNATTSADHNTICYDVDLTGNVSFKVEYKKARQSRPPVQPGLSITPDPEFTANNDIDIQVDKDALYTALRELNDDWSTPQKSWTVNAVKVTILENRDVVCRFNYTKSRLFSQPKSLAGFVVQPISLLQFRQLNKAIFGKESI